jgi:N-acetylglucosaminyl-diphospho-decaprenol L-rhamnosyltransferase
VCSSLQPRTGVVIVTRDRWATLRRTLAELRGLREGAAVVVVDNGSATPPPAGLCRQVGLVRVKRDIGAAARNLGVKMLSTPYVAFSDDDSWWAPDALGLAADLLDLHPRLGLIAARIFVGEDRRMDQTCSRMANSPLPPAPDDVGRPVLGFVACGAIVRRSAFLAHGGFDRRYGFGGEEELLALDLADAGWWLRYVPEIVAHHHPSPAHDRRGRARCQLRNALWSAWLRRPAGPALGRSARLLKGAGSDRGPAFVAALAGLPWVLADRRVIAPAIERQLRLLDRE